MRLGAAWAIALGVATCFLPSLAAVLMVPVTAIAAHSAWRRQDPADARPWWLAAAVCPLAALAGPVPALVAVVGVALVAAVASGQGRPSAMVRLALCVALPAAASASLIAACTMSSTIGLSLFIAVCLFDASNYVMGVGETGGGLGALAGMATLAVLALLLSGLFAVPFSGASPWILCGLVGIGAPLSIGVGHAIVGRVVLPAWRRLDSLFLVGPAWVVAAAMLLPH